MTNGKPFVKILTIHIQMTFKEKIKALLKQNGISEFVYHNTCYGDGPELPFAVSTYGIVNGLIKFIDLKSIKIITGFEVQNFKSKVLFLKKEGKWFKSNYTIFQAFNNGLCPRFPKPETDETENEHIYNILLQHFNFENKKGKNKSFEDIRNNIAKQLAEPFYQGVNTCVYIKQLDFNGVKINEDKLKTNYDKPCDITLNVTIKPNGSVNIKHVMADNYLKDQVKHWQEEANKRGLKVSAEELRKQVIKDFESQETEISFAQRFLLGMQKQIGIGVGKYVEAIQATQKIGKNIWEQGTINQSTWYSKDDEHKEWPDFAQFHPLVGGVTDGTVDEIVGIPVAIKGVYEIATDPEKQKALQKMFTKKGLGDLMDGLAKEAKDIANDPEKGQHFAGQTAVSVISMMSGAGLITKTGKIGKITEGVSQGLDEFASPKVIGVLDEVKKADRLIPEEKLLKEFVDEVGQDFIEESADEIADIALSEGKKISVELWKKLRERGQNFNKKIKELFPNPYSHHEVTIEHPTLKYKDGTPRRFRVDSYTPNIVIVERKATNFDKIQLKTFEGYLQSIKRKYPNGAKIVADDQTIRGSLLNGVQKIEVPKSNLNSKRLKEFQDLANSEKYKIEIIFIDE